jgi:FixJ family two-component response regulator
MLVVVRKSHRAGEFRVNETLANPGVIAIVDDDHPLREALESLMKAAGFSVKLFASAEEFLAWKDRDETVCLILDVRLPGMSGIELHKRLMEANRELPVIFVTAHGDASLQDSLMRAGASAFLSKPVRSGVLLKEIRTAMDKTRVGKQG